MIWSTIEDQDSLSWDVGIICGFEGVFEDLWLDDEELDGCGFDRVGELVGLVGGICASEDAAEGYDSIHEDWVADLWLCSVREMGICYTGLLHR